MMSRMLSACWKSTVIRAMLRFCTFSRVCTSITLVVTSSCVGGGRLQLGPTPLSSATASSKSSRRDPQDHPGVASRRAVVVGLVFSSVTCPAYRSTTFCTSICACADVVGAQRDVARADQRLLRRRRPASVRPRRRLAASAADVGGRPRRSPAPGVPSSSGAGAALGAAESPSPCRRRSRRSLAGGAAGRAASAATSSAGSRSAGAVSGSCPLGRQPAPVRFPGGGLASST